MPILKGVIKLAIQAYNKNLYFGNAPAGTIMQDENGGVITSDGNNVWSASDQTLPALQSAMGQGAINKTDLPSYLQNNYSHYFKADSPGSLAKIDDYNPDYANTLRNTTYNAGTTGTIPGTTANNNSVIYNGALAKTGITGSAATTGAGTTGGPNYYTGPNGEHPGTTTAATTGTAGNTGVTGTTGTYETTGTVVNLGTTGGAIGATSTPLTTNGTAAYTATYDDILRAINNAANSGGSANYQDPSWIGNYTNQIMQSYQPQLQAANAATQQQYNNDANNAQEYLANYGLNRSGAAVNQLMGLDQSKNQQMATNYNNLYTQAGNQATTAANTALSERSQLANQASTAASQLSSLLNQQQANAINEAGVTGTYNGTQTQAAIAQAAAIKQAEAETQQAALNAYLNYNLGVGQITDTLPSIEGFNYGDYMTQLSDQQTNALGGTATTPEERAAQVAAAEQAAADAAAKKAAAESKNRVENVLLNIHNGDYSGNALNALTTEDMATLLADSRTTPKLYARVQAMLVAALQKSTTTATNTTPATLTAAQLEKLGLTQETLDAQMATMTPAQQAALMAALQGQTGTTGTTARTGSTGLTYEQLQALMHK